MRSDDLRQQGDSTKFQRPVASAGLSIPNWFQFTHNIGSMVFAGSNFGRFGISNEYPQYDCFTGDREPFGQYPKGTTPVYLYKGGIWIGGIVGTDTLVSCGTDDNSWARELNPDAIPAGKVVKRSTLDPFGTEFEGAVSEQDYIVRYTDTVLLTNVYASFDRATNSRHRPMGISVTQSSYGWSYGYAADFTLFNLTIRNIYKKPIRQMYVGVYMDVDVGAYYPLEVNMGGPGSEIYKLVKAGKDDYAGFLLAAPNTYEQNACVYDDTVRVAWTADNDGEGNPVGPTFLVPNVIGTRFLAPPQSDENFSFNWWVQNFNLQKRKGYRDIYSAPSGDREKYAMMSNGEIDFDQSSLALRYSLDPVWTIPPANKAKLISLGGDANYLISIGPYDLDPGEAISVPFAIVGAQNFHTVVNNYYYNIRWHYDPREYTRELNMAALAKNAAWAAKVYDNPGVDTDSDGYSGKFHLCVQDSQFVSGHWVPGVVDTLYYEGDGVPDWKAASPPPPPPIWVIPKFDGLTVRWNGYRSETTKDYLSGEYDFEGYRVYMGRDERDASFAMIAAYDREDYDVYFYNAKKKPTPGWQLEGIPVTIDELRCRFSKKQEGCNDSTFYPLQFTLDNPWRSALYPDSAFYFVAHEANVYQFGVTTPIRKRFPDAPRPANPSNPSPDELTDDGYLKYWEYECDIDRLLPTLPYFVNVTALDFGSPKQGLLPLETAKSLHPKSAFPNADRNQSAGELPPVYIYPNPYRINENYRAKGYEGYGQLDKADNRVRAIHFVNLPPRCTVRILTLDGDLVKQIDHDVNPSDPKSNHDQWDLISRNTQEVVSGLYYWTVEGDDGRVQIGKLVIIM